MKSMKLKRVVLLAVLLVMSITAVTGGTIAWFTDEVTSANNVIESGKLDVELYYQLNGQTDWTKVDKNTNVFKQNALWEPGYAEVIKLKVVNEGNLAVKYVLGANVASETPSTNVFGQPFNLSSYIKAGVVEGPLPADRDQVIAAVDASADFLKDGSTTALHTLAPEGTKEFTLAVYMPTTVGNEANHAKDAAAPVINLGLKLLATQQTAEIDSFDNQYDAEASLWNGTYPGSQPSGISVDKTAKLISINDAQGFAYLNTLVNDPNFYEKYGSKWHYTIELNCNIDLLNEPWTPIVLKNFVAFDGNGHTIRNLNVSTSGNAGLFAEVACNDIGVTYIRNFTLDGATVKGGQSVGAVIGKGTQAAVQNVTVNNASVTGTKYVGGIFGWGNGAANNCTVKNSIIMIPVDGEKEAGGLIGYLSNDGKASTENKIISGNMVENVTVVAPTIASGLVSQPNSSNKGGAVIVIENNTLTNVKVLTKDDTADEEVSNNVGGKTVVQNNDMTNCTTGKGTSAYGLVLETADKTGTIYINDKEGLLNLGKLKENWVKLFSDGNGSAYSNYPNKAYYYHWGWTIELTADIDLGGTTVDPIDLGQRNVFNGNGHTIKNAKIVTDPSATNEAGLFVAAQCGMKNLKLDNIHVTGSNVGNSTAGVLSGSCNASVDSITITNSSVTGGKYTGGVVGYGYTDVTNCALTNVTVKGGYKLGGLIGYICASNDNTGEVTGNTLTGCTVDGIGGGVYAGGKDKYIVGKVVGNYNCNGTCNNNTVTNMTTSATENIGEIEAGKTVTQ